MPKAGLQVAAGVLSQSPRAPLKGRLERVIEAPYAAVFQTVTRPDWFMSLRKSVSQVVAVEDNISFVVTEIFMGAEAEFVLSVYPYNKELRIHHSGKATYFCVDALIDYTFKVVSDTQTSICMEYVFVMPKLIASFCKNIVARDRKNQLEAIATYAQDHAHMSIVTPDALVLKSPIAMNEVDCRPVATVEGLQTAATQPTSKDTASKNKKDTSRNKNKSQSCDDPQAATNVPDSLSTIS